MNKKWQPQILLVVTAAILLARTRLFASPEDIINRKSKSTDCPQLALTMLGRPSAGRTFAPHTVDILQEDDVIQIEADRLQEEHGHVPNASQRAELMRVQSQLSDLLARYGAHSIQDLPPAKIKEATKLRDR